MTERPRNNIEAELDRAEEQLWNGLRHGLDTAGDDQPPRDRMLGWLRSANVGAPWLRVVAHGERPAESRRARPWALGVGLATLGAAAATGLVTLILENDTPNPPVASADVEALSKASAPEESPRVPARSELVLASGEVTVDGKPPRVGTDPLLVGQRIGTARGLACLTADPDVDLCLDEHSEVRIVSLDPKRLSFDVLRGSAVAQLSPLPSGRSFSLVAAGLSAQAVGTVYQVTHDEAQQQAVVMVLAGAVDVVLAPGQRARRVPSHQRLAVDLGSSRAGELETIGRVEESPVWTRLAVAKWWNPAEVGVVEVVAEGSASTDVRIDGGPALPLPIHALLPLGAHRLVASGNNGTAREIDFEVTLGERRRVTAGSATTEAEGAALVRPSPAALLAKARELRTRGDGQRALATYQELQRAFPASAEARTVLVTMGKLELELGRPEQALANFEAYLRSPGALSPEALGGKVSALRALGRREEEQAAMRDYLARHPEGFLAPRFEQRLQSLR